MINKYINDNKNMLCLVINKANKKKILLNNDQLFIIINVLNFYNEYKISPNIKMLIFYINKKFNINFINYKYIKSNFINDKLIYSLSNIPYPLFCMKN